MCRYNSNILTTAHHVVSPDVDKGVKESGDAGGRNHLLVLQAGHQAEQGGV